jgi:nicotinamide mononucleotide (NMN) deamidase PncC
MNYATVESLTGGALAALFTSVDGSSGYFVGGTIMYQESTKRQFGVDAIGARFERSITNQCRCDHFDDRIY